MKFYENSIARITFPTFSLHRRHRNPSKTVGSIVSFHIQKNTEKYRKIQTPLELQSALNPADNLTFCKIYENFIARITFSSFSLHRRHRNHSKTVGSIDSVHIQKKYRKIQKIQKNPDPPGAPKCPKPCR